MAVDEPKLPSPTRDDVIAGVSVALVLIPQSHAYAEPAGLPLALKTLVDDARLAGLDARVASIPPHAVRVLNAVWDGELAIPREGLDP